MNLRKLWKKLNGYKYKIIVIPVVHGGQCLLAKVNEDFDESLLFNAESKEGYTWDTKRMTILYTNNPRGIYTYGISWESGLYMMPADKILNHPFLPKCRSVYNYKSISNYLLWEQQY